MYEIQDITIEKKKQIIHLKETDSDFTITLPQSFIEINFNMGYANTIYCVQGLTIKEKYNIHDLSSMNINEAYTALSRCQSINNVNFNYTDKTFKKHSYV